MEGQAKATVALTFALYQGEGTEPERRETITQDIVKIGSDPKSHLRLEEASASRMHAVIEVGGADDLSLIDLGNDPGTLVNGERITKTKLRSGDAITIGSTRIVLEAVEVSEAVVEAVAEVAAAAAVEPPAAVEAPVAARVAPVPPVVAPSAPKAIAPAASNPFAAAASNPFAAASNPFASAANPFAAAAPAKPASTAVADDAPEGSYTYQLVRSGPEVNPDEVELAHVPAVEVMILWGTTVLHVDHLTPPRSYYVGEEEANNLSCDYFVPAEKLGAARAPIVLADRGGAVNVVLLPRSKGTIEIPGQTKLTIEEAIKSGKAQPCAELSGAHQFALPPGAKARVDVDGIVFQVSAVPAGKPFVHGPFANTDWSTVSYLALSLVAHGGLIAAMAFFKPHLGLTDDEGLSRDQQYLIQQYLLSAAEREQEKKETDQVTDAKADDKEGGTGTKAKGDEGSMGNPNTQDRNKRYAVEGPKDNPDPHIARQAALRDAAEFGMVGLLNTGAGGDPNAPTAPWGADTSSGIDPLSARGNMWGDSIGDAFGAGGLGLTGIGEGGGGRGEGIGLGNIGTIGHGAGTGTGQGFGSGSGRLSGGHKVSVPQVRMGQTQVNGRLPPEVIQRIVRQNFGRFRLCYENGLRNNPNLTGRVSVRFVIGRDGAVSNVGNGGSDMPDQSVVQCVIRQYYGLSFPPPDGGIVTVVYPISFAPE